MKKYRNLILGVLVVIAAGVGVSKFLDYRERVEADTVYEMNVEVPQPGERISSPVTISGYAHANWFLGDIITIEIQNESGDVVGQGIATKQEGVPEDAHGYLPFKASIPFVAYPGDAGYVVLKRTNPEREYGLRTEIPITF